MKLRQIAHSRTGDKGTAANISVIAYRAEDYPILERYLTAARVKEHFGSMVTGDVTRYEAPNVLALNFVMHGALSGGGPRSLRSDSLGKTLGGALVRMEIDVPASLALDPGGEMKEIGLAARMGENLDADRQAIPREADGN